MASLVQSSAMPSTMRHQLSSIAFTPPFSSSLKSVRTFSSFCSLQRRTQAYSQKNKHIYLSASSPKSLPAIQQSRTFLAKITRKFPATAHTTRTPTEHADVEVAQTQIPPLQLTNLPYFVRRTPSNQLPVYLETKAGGTKKLTKIQKTEGDLEALRSDLARALGLESGDPHAKKSPEVTVNPVNGHIIVKGWRKPEIQKFLTERNF